MANKDCDLIISNLNASIESVIDNIFNLDEKQKSKIKEDEAFKDLTNLRVAKLIIKLRTQIQQLKIILNSEEYLKEEVILK